MNRRIQRWDPRGDLSSLEAAVNTLFEDGLSWSRGGPADQATLQVDVLETSSRYEILASVPGLQPEDVMVTVVGDSVRITSEGATVQDDESERERGDADRRWLVRERYVGRQERTITLPSSVRADDVTANFQDGVLTVILPKADTVRARRIQISTGSGAPAENSPIDVETSDRTANP